VDATSSQIIQPIEVPTQSTSFSSRRVRTARMSAMNWGK
jgi:hypothetical protein